ARSFAWNRQLVHSEKRQLVPIAALKSNCAVFHLEKSAAAQAQRIAPFQYGPLTVLEDVLHNAVHVRNRKLSREHRADRFTPRNRLLRDLMIYSRFSVQRSQTISIRRTESCYPHFNNFPRTHLLCLTVERTGSACGR